MTIGSGHKQIGQLLLQAGVIDDLQLRSALGHQRQWGGRLGRILMELKFIDENTLVATLARQLGLESTRITGEGLDPKVIALVPQTIAERYWIFPLSLKDSKGGGELTVAVADPTNLASVEDVRFHTGKRIKVVVAPESDIEGAIKRFYYGDATAPLAVAPAKEEVFASSPTSLSGPEDDLMELEPIPTDSQVSVPAPRISDDPLENFFDGLTPPPVTGAEALVNFAPPASVVAPPPPSPPNVFLDPVTLGTQAVAPEAPPPLRVEASAFDSPTPAAPFAPPSPPPSAPPPVSSPAAEAAPFIGEDEVSFQEPEPTEAPPIPEPAPSEASAVAAPYPSGAEAALFEAAAAVLPPPPSLLPEVSVPVDVDVDVGAAAEVEAAPSGALPFDLPTAAEVSPAQPEVAFAVDLDADATTELPSEAAPFAALAPPLVGAAAVSVPSVIVSPLAVAENPPASVEARAGIVEVAPEPAATPEPAAVSFAPSQPPLAVPPESMVAPGPLGVAPFTEGELQIFDSLEARLAGGAEPAQVINPAQLVSALIRLLLRKGLLAEAELIEELQKR